MQISAALLIYSAPKHPHIVAAGCDKESDGQFSLFTFPRNPERRAQWSREVAKTRSNWSGPSDQSVLCSLHFTKDSFEASIALTTELALPAKRRKLKDSAVQSLFPKASKLHSSYEQSSQVRRSSTLSVLSAIYFHSLCDVTANWRKSSFDDVTNYKMTDFGNLILDFLPHAAIACN